MGDFDNHERFLRVLLEFGKYSGADRGMGQRLQLVEGARVGKHDLGEPGPVNPTLDHRLWPPTTDRGIGLPLRLEDRMADLICMYHRDSPGSEDGAYGALAGPDSSRQKQPNLPKFIHGVTVP